MKSHVLAGLGLCCLFYCTTGKAQQDTTAPVRKDSTVQQDTTKKDTTTQNTTGVQKTDTSGLILPDTTKKTQTVTDTTRKPTQDTARKPAQDTALILPSDSAAQQPTAGGAGAFTLTGIVQDTSETPIPGAKVLNKATGQAVASDPTGKFSIKASPRDSIVVSAVSYGEQTIPVKDQKPLTISLSALSSGQKTLSEVVVTALGIRKNARAVGYALQEVSGNAVQEAKEVNFVNSLSGKVAGLQVNTNTGSMGGSTKMTIRGNKSILGDNNAFIVVDGVPVLNNVLNEPGQQNGGGGYDYGSPIQDINPEDIENISVLKGAAATALYGSRGANGVLLITTKKKPDIDKGLGITYSLNAQIDQVYVLPKYQNQYGGGYTGFDTLYYNQHPEAFLSEQAATYNDNNGKGPYDLMPQFYADESWGPKLDGRLVRHYWSFDKDKGNPDFGKTAPWSPQPNNVKSFYKTGTTITNNIAVGGSNDKGSMRLSYGNTVQTFVLPNSKLNRNNLSFNGNYLLAKNLNAVASINYSVLDAKGRPGTGFTGPNPTLQFTMFGQRQLDMKRAQNYLFPDGSQITWNRTTWDDATVKFSNGPYWNSYRDYENDSRNRLFGLAGLDYTVLPWLTLSGRVFMDQYNMQAEERMSQQPNITGSYIKRIRDSREMNYQVTADINKDFGKLSLDATIGGNIMHRKATTTGGSTVGGLIIPGVYNLNNSVQTALPLDQYYEKQINSAFATATLGYKNLLFLDLTGRSDWSSTINVKNNPYFYPSASLSFVFSDLLKWKWMDFGKIRGSIAAVGSDTDPFQVYDTYAFIPPFGSSPVTQFTGVKNNQLLKPERTREYEFGTEMRFFDNRIGFDVTYYNRNTRDQIITMPVPAATGFSLMVVNGGNVRNQGIEVGLNLNPIRLKSGFRWDINVNFARNRNKLLDMNIEQFNTQLDQLTLATDRRTQKVSIAALVGQSLGTIMGTDYVYDEQGRKKVTPAGFYQVSDIKEIGNVNPDYIGGINNSFSFKGVYLSALIDFQHGGDFFSYTNLYGKKSGLLDVTAENGIRENGIVVPGVTDDGKDNTVNISAKDHFSQNFGNVISKADLYDASYIYLREVKLGYNLPESWYSKIGAQAARISLYGRNLWLMHSNAPNVDPSNITNSASNVQGIEGGALPSLRSYGVNLNVSF
ncbi:MAG TPA: SusC/RagA family TonB-linked outer membrane protein [Chitinophaga sp.]|uniref:SusC/RagA family TonB-linked outer membrane protein n=1 Tax=Chitinophaga sp. TaxID=1869181 RepID=UPI002DBBDBA7|nr:SusC/RagA family TonB-linked outer membrane protein [Chitinophaga sp.]HEU4553345.1 SusC/RagA family TonB-linked outer membrane protein [Chitinophaga sp.]